MQMKANHQVLLATLFAFAAAGCGGADTDADMEMADDTADAAAMEADPTMAPEGAATGLPAGFELRLDRTTDNAADFHVMEMGGGWHIETGPRAIVYNAADNAVESGDYTVSASFTEIGAPPNHREALGLFFGGQNLQAPDYTYSYFVVRATGEYLIKKRVGEETEEVTEGWVASEAVNAATPDGADVTNTLQVMVMGDQVHFSINGTEVATMPAAELDVHGVAGVRMNHNLKVMVNDWNLTRGM
jgi:hypothetical protein